MINTAFCAPNLSITKIDKHYGTSALKGFVFMEEKARFCCGAAGLSGTEIYTWGTSETVREGSADS